MTVRNLPGLEETIADWQTQRKTERLWNRDTTLWTGQDEGVARLEAAGFPAMRIEITDACNPGQEFLRREFAAAVAGSPLGIHPFNQLDVEGAKVAAQTLPRGWVGSPAKCRQSRSHFQKLTSANPLSQKKGEAMTLKWNLVTKHLHGHELLRKKLHQKITTLEKHLKHFPPDAVHLHIALERNPKKEHYTAALTLRVPSNILRSEKSSPDVIKAYDDAVKALLRELESLKAELRRETFWKRRERREQLHELKAARFAPEPQPEGTGPQNLGDVIRELLGSHYKRLLRYVRRQLWHDISAGEAPRDAIDPRAVVDEVARRALVDPRKKPAGMEYLPWFYVLARQELARRRKALKTAASEAVPLEAPQFLPEDLAVAEGYDAEQPLDIIERQIKPPVAETKDLLPDTRVEPPDEATSRRELLAELRRLASAWPRPERELFELYYVEGFEPDEAAMILGAPEKRVREMLAAIQQRLRAEALKQALV